MKHTQRAWVTVSTEKARTEPRTVVTAAGVLSCPGRAAGLQCGRPVPRALPVVSLEHGGPSVTTLVGG